MSHFKLYLYSLVSAVCGFALTSNTYAAITGQWNFEAGDLSATTGRSMDYLDGPEGETAQQTVFGTASELGLADPGDGPVHVLGFPQALPSMGFILYPDIAANGGGVLVNQYTLIFDILFPAESSSGWRGLLQIDSFDNSNDADLHINPSGAVGVSGQYHGTVQADTWHRLAFVFDLVDPAGPRLDKFIDGVLVGQQTLGEGPDGRWSLNPAGNIFGDQILLFTDDNADGGNTQPGFVSSIQAHDEALSSAYIAALGAPDGNQIPGGIAFPAAVINQKPAPDTKNVMPGTKVEVVLAPGSESINTATISLQVNGQSLTPNVETSVDGNIVIQSSLPDLAALSDNILQLQFTDPVGGPINSEWSFQMAPFGDHPEIAEGLSSDLIAHWPLDEGADNPDAVEVTDVVSGVTGAFTSSSPASSWLGSSEARFDGALRLDGSDSYVTIASNPVLDIGADQMTLSLWVSLEQLPSELPDGFGGIYDSAQDAYVLYLDRGAGELRFKTTSANGNAARPGIPEDRLVRGEWLHLAAVYDGRASETAGEARIYLNGELMDSHVGNDGSGGTGLTGLVRTGQTAGLGRDGDQARYFLASRIDDIAIWKRPLTVDEIGYLAAGKVVPPLSGAPDPLIIAESPESQTAVEGTSVTFNVTVAGGRPPITYQWLRNGTDLPDANQPQLVVIAGQDTAGDYTVLVVDDSPSSVESEPATLSVTPIATDPADSLLQGLAAHWPLDEGASNASATTIADAAGSADAALTTSDPSDIWLLGADARFGAALRVDGENTYVTMPQGGSLDIESDQLTLSAWVNLDAMPSELPEGFGGIYDSVQDNYVLYMDRGNAELRFKVTVAGGNAARPGIFEKELIAANEDWLHVAGVYDGRATPAAGEARIYLNGQLMDSHLGNDGSDGAGLTGLVRAGQAAAIGRNGTESRYFLQAGVDDVAVWNRALSETELAYLAEGNAVPVRASTEPLRLLDIDVIQGQVRLSWEGGAAPYQVQWRPALVDGDWLDVGGETTEASAAIDIAAAMGFYRVVRSEGN